LAHIHGKSSLQPPITHAKHCADAAAAVRGDRDELLTMMTMSLD
jgi:hypothetical protein